MSKTTMVRVGTTWSFVVVWALAPVVFYSGLGGRSDSYDPGISSELLLTYTYYHISHAQMWKT